jgi:hypothetical protein
MGSPSDPRLVELKRLQRALDAAARHLDEYEARVFRTLQKTRGRAAAAKSVKLTENSFASHIVAGMTRFREER